MLGGVGRVTGDGAPYPITRRLTVANRILGTKRHHTVQCSRANQDHTTTCLAAKHDSGDIRGSGIVVILRLRE